MATTLQAPRTDIFDPTAVETAYAKGVLDLDQGGLAGALYNAARSDRGRVQQTYLDALRESNMMSAKLGAYQSDQDLLGTLLKTAAEHANAGIDPSTIPVTGRMYANPADPLTRQPAFLSRDKKAAEAAKLRAEAANTGASHADQYTVVRDVSPGGIPGTMTLTGKGRNPQVIQKTVDGLVATAGPGGAPNPGAVIRNDGSVGQVPIADARTIAQGQVVAGRPSASNAQARGQQTRADAEAKARAEANRTQKKLENQ